MHYNFLRILWFSKKNGHMCAQYPGILTKQPNHAKLSTIEINLPSDGCDLFSLKKQRKSCVCATNI